MIDETMILPLSNEGDCIKTKYEAIFDNPFDIFFVGHSQVMTKWSSELSCDQSWSLNFSIETRAKKLFAFLIVKDPVDQ